MTGRQAKLGTPLSIWSFQGLQSEHLSGQKKRYHHGQNHDKYALYHTREAEGAELLARDWQQGSITRVATRQ